MYVRPALPGRRGMSYYLPQVTHAPNIALKGLSNGGNYPWCSDVDPNTGVTYESEGSPCSSATVLNTSSGAPLPAPLQNILTQMQQSQNPLDYVSPQAAIAAGIDEQTANAAWTRAMAAFPTAQAALNAGVSPTVVTQLWSASRAFVKPAVTSWFDQSPLGIANKYLLAGAGGLLLLTSMGRRR